MQTYFEKINDNIFSFLLWDETWRSFNNCYLIVDGNEVILIDSGKTEDFGYLGKSLESIQVGIDGIQVFLATHGHKDHIGGVQFLKDAERFIHKADKGLLPDTLSGFTGFTSDNGMVNGIEYILLGHHTPGSTAFYHEKSKTLFCGDHLCFFGDPLPNGNVVVEGSVVKGQVRQFVTGWAGNQEMRDEYNFALFIKGLTALCEFDADYLCTGHGAIIKDNIGMFLSDVLKDVKA